MLMLHACDSKYDMHSNNGDLTIELDRLLLLINDDISLETEEGIKLSFKRLKRITVDGYSFSDPTIEIIEELMKRSLVLGHSKRYHGPLEYLIGAIEMNPQLTSELNKEEVIRLINGNEAMLNKFLNSNYNK